MTQPTGGETGREGLFAALKNTVATLIAIGKTRAELLLVELEEEKLRLMSLWSKAIGAAFMLAVGVVLLVFCVAIAFWEQRVLVFGLFTALFLGGGFWLLAAVQRQAARPRRLLRGSLSELERDIAELRRQAEGPK